MKLIIAILLIVPRLVVAIFLMCGTCILALLYGIFAGFKYGSLIPLKKFLAVSAEVIRDGFIFPVWPVIKIFKSH